MAPLAHPSRNTRAKGHRLERLARQCLETQGFRVETAPNVVVWIKDPATGRQKPISTRHDFFGLWDLLAVGPSDGRGFVQVATLDHIAHRRAKILASGFPCTRSDILAGYKGGRDRHFRLFRGPRFERWDGECWRPPKQGDTRAPVDPADPRGAGGPAPSPLPQRPGARLHRRDPA